MFLSPSRRIAATLLLCLLVWSPANAQRQRKCFVHGKVVDANGTPVNHAYVVLDAEPPESWEDLIGSIESDAEGNFSAETLCPVPRRRQWLYVTSPLSFDNLVLYSPPFRRNRETDSRFMGQVVKNTKAVDFIDLGQVRLQVSYTTVTLHLQNEVGAPLINDWRPVWLKVRNDRRQTVSDGGLSIRNIETAVDKPTSSIRIQLPEGTWWLEINTNEDRGKWLKARLPVVARKSTDLLELTLRFS
jgi:hypothetical protein